MNIKNLNSSEAYKILEEARKLNPGEWVDHSINAGKVARKIAIALGEDADKAESYGYLHDIGRRTGRCGLKHIIEGYKYLTELGYTDVAKICLTHSFYTNTIEGCIGKWDMLDDEKEFIKKYIETVELNIYDKIIQLSDSIATSTGVTMVERRMVDVFFRYGFNEYTERNIRDRLKLQSEIEDRLGYSIYKLFKEELANNLESYKVEDAVAFKNEF